ncbi:hypothetical protein SDC9_110919 [bioreactor metagenome]|uniref:Uncharacterized protein n=1 Tax=bioreactor metagenome TaxID=1076179 RepID=A0A645BLB8_9ZZZZ|nr:hypothetical protein [Methanosarcina mazei]MDY0387250.1 hypothetical protein [Methanolobus sp.]WIM43424.1 hypothetical protein PSF70_00860 [Methanosarcina mazei]WIM46875.1 hypothetical protein PQQ20_00860 [Methanosarcina mazei]
MNTDTAVAPIDPEILSRMPESFQLFYQIQQEAAEEVRQILENVKTGKTTIEEEKLKRGIK